LPADAESLAEQSSLIYSKIAWKIKTTEKEKIDTMIKLISPNIELSIKSCESLACISPTMTSTIEAMEASKYHRLHKPTQIN